MNYIDPKITRQVAEWSGLEARIKDYTLSSSVPVGSDERDLRVEVTNPDKSPGLWIPWSNYAKRWQLNYLLEAVEDAGIWDEFVEYLKDKRLDHRFDLSLFDVMTADPLLVYEAVVDTLVGAGEIDVEED